MKFVVDEMPFWKEDCPFYNIGQGTCALCPGDVACRYMAVARPELRDEVDCAWLVPLENYFTGGAMR